jgi:hypothetical protein
MSREEKLFVRLNRIRLLHPVFIFIIWLIAIYTAVDFKEAIKNEFFMHQIPIVLPLPYVLSIFSGLLIKYTKNERQVNLDTKTFNLQKENPVTSRKYDRLFVCLVSKGVNKDAVYRSWDALQMLQDTTRGIYVYVVSDEPYYFEDLNTVIVPSMFECRYARAKARALEYFRQQMRLTEKDWVLHLDEVCFSFKIISIKLTWLYKTKGLP